VNNKWRLVGITSDVSIHDRLQGLKWRCGALHQSREGEIVRFYPSLVDYLCGQKEVGKKHEGMLCGRKAFTHNIYTCMCAAWCEHEMQQPASHKYIFIY
jgi:hypothetical protein